MRELRRGRGGWGSRSRGQRRRHIAVSGDEQGRDIAPLGAVERIGHIVRARENAWSRKVEVKLVGRDLTVVIHYQNRVTERVATSKFVWDLDDQSFRRHVIDRRGHAV